MDMVTVKRNGVFISFPKFERINGDVRDDVIAGTRVKNTINLSRRNVPSKKNAIAYLNINVGCIPQRRKSVMKSVIEIKANTGKLCMRCGESCWRSDVNYCWDCYKYEKFESK